MSGKMVPVKISKQGRLVVPAELRRELGIAGEDDLVASVEEGSLILRRRSDVERELWAMIAERKLDLDEFLREKREEAAREEARLERWEREASERS